jgi:cytochrome c oxidase assembly protein subunit 15
MSKRAIFEDVTATERAAPTLPAARREARGLIAAWLWTLAGLVALMVLVGGMTRLTDSGLSITVWDPVMGAIPPLSDADWEAAFAAYKTTTEYQVQNNWMTLADFKPIFWWEWGHRFLGRFIGLVWIVGLLAFQAARAVPAGWSARLVLPGALGGVQGAIGWWMVSSGLDRLDVASYRLATHLGLAFVIFALLVWYALKIRLDPVRLLQARRRRPAGLPAWTSVLMALVFVQILGGALVAGIDAGRSYVDWPLMQGQWFPDGALALTPLWHNFFESAGLVQFNHRVLGYVVAVAAILFAVRALRSGQSAIRSRAVWVAAAVFAQMVAGIFTVLNAAAPEIAIFHQGGALVVFALLVSARFAILYPPAQKITA